MTKTVGEFRSEKRIRGQHAIFVCYPSQDGSQIEEKHTCKIEDISEGGLKVVTRRPLPLGCILPIDIHVIHYNSVFKFSGEVKWCLEIDAAPTYFAGIKLIKLLDTDYQKWRQIANNKYS